jgi:pantothenate kinase-related protein Tda10
MRFKLTKHQSWTPNPKSSAMTSMKRVTKPYVLGVCGGPGSGMSTVAKNIKKDLIKKAGVSCTLINLLDFYKPIRGNMRRTRSRAGSLEIADPEK